MKRDQLQEQGNFWMRLAKRFFGQNLFLHASALTTTTLLGIVPVFVVVFSIIAMLPAGNHLHSQIQAFIFNNFVPGVSETIQSNLDLFLSQSKHLPIVSVIFLFIVSIWMLFTIKRIVNKIWRIPTTRQTIFSWVLYYITILIAFFFMLFAFASTSYLLAIPGVSHLLKTWGVSSVIFDIVSFVLTVLAFTLLYKIFPSGYVPWRFAFFGAFAATILFLIVKYIFLAYITYFPTYQLLYGAMAAIPIFILWVFISWLIVLFGVLLSSMMFEPGFRKEGKRA